MKLGLLVLLISILLLSCKPVVRPDPYPPSIETNDYNLLTQFCGQTGTTIGCSLEFDNNLPSNEIVVYTPYIGDISFYGCGIDEKQTVSTSGRYSHELPHYFFSRPDRNCILDILYTWRLPDQWKQTIPTRAMRGRVYLTRGEPNSKHAQLEYHGNTFEGIASLKLRQGFEASGSHLLRLKLTQPTDRGYFSMMGCGSGIKEQAFKGDELTVNIAQLITPPSKVGDCFLFGFAVGVGGLDNFFSLGMNIFDKSTVRVGARAYLDKKKVCYESDSYVSLVAYGGQISNSTKDCFKRTEETLISFYTVQGRAAYLQLKGDTFVWME
jgi:hypothetical protein